tara:strand:+ start:136 stop:717 length:582 start_codon:yes stop_codon:yes gene_type:complete
MFISHKSNVIQVIDELDWRCRQRTKGMTKPEYWVWLDSVTTDKVADYSGETGYTIVECTDEDVQERLKQLQDYISQHPTSGITYNIKYYASKRDAEEILDTEGKSQDPKVYVQSHFVPDDTAKDKRILDFEWELIRRKRDRLLTESDWSQANDTALSDADVAKWKTYRTSLRDLPSDQSSKTKYSDITWPTKP